METQVVWKVQKYIPSFSPPNIYRYSAKTTFSPAFHTSKDPKLYSLFGIKDIMPLTALLKNKFTLEQWH